jgi:hypothetical protein
LRDDGDYYAKNYHGGDREIKFEIFFFNSNIAGQPADPMQLIMKKINDHANKNYHDPANDHIFTGIAVHDTKLKDQIAFIILT